MDKITHLVICPGHGGIDPETGQYVTAGKQYHFTGANPFSIYEGARQRVLAGMLVSALRSLAPTLRVISALDGHDLYLDNSCTHRDTPLSERVGYANQLPAATTLYLSLHSNAAGMSSRGPGTRARGVCVFTSEGQTGSDLVADALHHAIAEADVLPMRSNSHEDGDPDYEAGFYVLRRTRCRAVLIELGFHDNRQDALVLMDDSALESVANQLAIQLAHLVEG